MLCAYIRPRYQASVYRSIRSLVNFGESFFLILLFKKSVRDVLIILSYLTYVDHNLVNNSNTANYLTIYYELICDFMKTTD